MDWYESQIDARARIDDEALERAYATLAASVTDPKKAPTITVDELEQADGAVRACLHYCHARPGEVPDGVEDLDARIEYLCRTSGAMHRVVRLEPDWHKNVFGALVGRLKTGEVVALLPRGRGGYSYLEPGTARKVRVTKAVAQNMEDEAVLFYRPLPSRSLTIRDLLQFMFSTFDRGDYLAVLVAVAATTLVGLLPAWANQLAFSTVIPSNDYGLIMPIASLLLGVAVSSVLIGMCRNLVMARVSVKMDVAVQAATFARVLSLPTSFFKQYASGNLASRISQVNQLTQQLLSMLLGSGLTSIFSLAYVVQIAVFAPSLVAPALLVVVLQSALTVVSTLMESRWQQAAMEASATLSGEETSLLNGMQKIKLAGAEERAFVRWADYFAAFARNTYNRPVLVKALPAIVGLVGLLGNIAIYYLAGSTHVSVADYMAFNTAYGQTTAAIMALAGIAGQIAQIHPMLKMIAPILEAQPETADDRAQVGELNGGIEVSGVSFRYNDDSPYVLHDLSFKVKPGEYVALVGKSGCGKSTILRLLLGFETPERGSVFFGPHDVSKVDLRTLRQGIGMVMQDGRLFMGDIASNITIASPRATLDDAWAAAELAGIADDIRSMPMGMQTMVTEGGGGISGGQRQRIMIARAICGDKRILMFDEATSALDNKTQKHVSDSLESLHCTRLVVAHRLSTVRHCDRIMVVSDGHIAEEGTYEELIEQGGMFAELVARQRLDAEA